METWFDLEHGVINAATDYWLAELPSEITHTCWWAVVETSNTRSKWISIYVVHRNIFWNCQCNLIHLIAILSSTFKA